MTFNEIMNQIAKMLNGTIQKDDYPCDYYCQIHFDNNIGVSFRQGYGSKLDKINAHAFVHGISPIARQTVDRPNMPEITFSMGKEIHKIISDIQNRLIALSHEPIAKLKSDIEKYNEQTNSLQNTVNELETRHPNVTFRVENQRISFSYYSEKTFFSGYSYGKDFTIDKIFNLSQSQLERIFDILTENK